MDSIMISQGAMVTYKESSRKLDGNCGIIERIVEGQPNVVWVRWAGEITTRMEQTDDLEVI